MEFVYDSADAAGQNAVTVTTWHACQWALDKITRECPDINIMEFYLDTKFSGDKNAVPKNYIKGRGIEVQAEAYITESVLQRVLKVMNRCEYEELLHGSLDEVLACQFPCHSATRNELLLRYLRPHHVA